MLDINQKVEVTLNSITVKYYEYKGYDIDSLRVKDKQNRLTVPKGTKLCVSICDLAKNSNVKIIVKCDYCGKEYRKAFSDYNKNLNASEIKKCACKSCTKFKNEEVLNLRYGVLNISSIDGVREKIKNTNIQKYGVECSLQNEEIKNKIKITMIEKYGVEVPIHNLNIKQKIIKTNLNKYGVFHFLQLDENKKKLRNDRRLPFEKIEKCFIDNNFTLLINEEEYENSLQAMKCFCNKHSDIVQYKKYNHLT